jgi:anhydro-N-acetylmuramic acid kinase
VGEKLLWNGTNCFLNIGGIANISIREGDNFIAFDVCPANRVLNLLAGLAGKLYDEDGDLAKNGTVNTGLLEALNGLDYYTLPYPKALANEFGTGKVFPLIRSFNLSVEDALRTYVEHIALQVSGAFLHGGKTSTGSKQLLVTGGGALNVFLTGRLKEVLKPLDIEVVIPETNIVQYKEALIMALLGVLRWREENTVLSSVTGAVRNSIGGAVWIGQEA